MLQRLILTAILTANFNVILMLNLIEQIHQVFSSVGEIKRYFCVFGSAAQLRSSLTLLSQIK